MGKFKILGLLIACVTLSTALAGAGSAAEFRGAWVSAWTPGYFTKEQCDATIAAAKKAGINALFIQARKNADAYYDSKLEPRASAVAPGFDPLAYMTEKAHEQGIQVHAWVVMYRLWTAKTDPTDPNNIVNKHPDWINLDENGKNRASEGLYLDPGIPEVREYLVSILEDIVKRYNIDGIHYDYIRYPGWKWGYSQTSLNRYYAETGTATKPDFKDPKWMQWRRTQVSALVKLAHDRIKAIKPKILISASTIAWGDCPEDFSNAEPYFNTFQDWKMWLSQGWIDANCPMCYKVEKNAKSAQSLRNWLGGFKKWNGGQKVYVGLDVHGNSPDDILKQISAIRKYGHEGFSLFSFNESQRRNELVEKFSTAIGPAEALPICKPEPPKVDVNQSASTSGNQK